MQCPCQSKLSYSECCERYHDGQLVPTAEALMRSRYSAFAVHNDKYIYKSWSKTTRPSKKSLKQIQANQWLGLTILRTELGLGFDTEGVVEFIAHYQSDDRQQQLHEVSRFVRENNKWVYLDGTDV